MASGAFALKLGEVIDDGHILKCASKNPKRPFPKWQYFTRLNIIHNNIEYTTLVYKNIRKGMQTILIPGPRVSYLLWEPTMSLFGGIFHSPQASKVITIEYV